MTQFLQQTVLTMDQNSSLTALALLLSIVIFWRAVVLRKRSVKQEALIQEQSESLKKIQTQLQNDIEIRKREEHFQKNLQHAEVTTELQKSRSTYVHQRNSQRPPERYGYARSMFRTGMTVDEISSALGMSHVELTQLFKLDTLCGNSGHPGNDKNFLPGP